MIRGLGSPPPHVAAPNQLSSFKAKGATKGEGEGNVGKVRHIVRVDKQRKVGDTDLVERETFN